MFTLVLVAKAEWTPVFNGQDLTEWSGDPRLWRVENGVIIGETDTETRKTEAPSFLIWKGGKPEDFELKFQARITGSNNSGVQYRSCVIDAVSWKVGGYQLDINPQPISQGMLYESQGRGVICENGKQVKFRDAPEITNVLKTNQVDLSNWNAYRIVAKGRQLHHFINDQLVVDVRDESLKNFSSRGVIALQLNHGAATRVEFKDLLIEQNEKTKTQESQTVAWLWSNQNPQKDEKVFFRREIQLPSNILNAIITVACDDEQRLFLNGKDIGKSTDWANPPSYDVTANLKPGGRNVIALECTNRHASAGMALRLSITLKEGERLNIISDGNWKCSSEASEGWNGLDFQEGASWQKAFIISQMGDKPWGNLMPQ
ncbi:MAG: DUF1080 domain-containing protein [Akkermansiaceae bacterium]|nr:DUF1080 domain-containing protein [Akkermansiaceae bacterium]